MDGPVRGWVSNAASTLRGRRLPFVLCYHGVGEQDPAEDPHGLMTRPAAFAGHLDLLTARGYRLVGLEELWSAVQRGGTAADGLGAVTFDDGLADTLEVAAGMLTARGAVGTAFLAPGLFGGDHPDLPPGRRILRADEVAGLERRGIGVGAHSYSHSDLPLLPYEQQLDELVRSRETLEELVGYPVRTMAYPYGRYAERTQAAAREAGYELACANSGSGPWRALELPREAVFPSTGTGRLRLKAAGLHRPLQALRSLVPVRRSLP